MLDLIYIEKRENHKVIECGNLHIEYIKEIRLKSYNDKDGC